MTDNVQAAKSIEKASDAHDAANGSQSNPKAQGLTFHDAVGDISGPGTTKQPDASSPTDDSGNPDFTIFVHKSITDEALKPFGLNYASRFGVEVGDLAQDLDRQTRGTPTHHFDDDSLAGSVAGIDQHTKNIEQMLAKPQLSADDETAIFHEFGQKLHTLQDFYAHSNYVELQLKSNPDLQPEQLPLMNFDNIRNGQTDPIRTGFYYYKNAVQNEGTGFFLSRTGVINHLNKLGEQIPNTTFLPTDQYKEKQSFEDRLNYFADPKYSVLHADLNKDDTKSDEGKVVDPNTGIDLHQYARDLAVRETQKQWQEFEDTVRKVRPNDADNVLNQLKNMSFSGQLEKERFSVDGIITQAIMDGKAKYKPR